MTTITKERLLTIKQWRETYGPDSNVVLPAEEAEELARIALASLEAKPIGAFHIAEQQVDGTSDYLKDGEWPIDNGIIEVYAAPPVPVVPEEKPMPNPLSMYAVDAVAAIAEVRGWNACRAAMLQSGNFRENKNSSTNNFREIAETSTNYPVIPSEVLSAIQKVAKIRADFDDFDGDRRGIGDCLDEAEQELIVTINKYASQLAAEPIAPNDVREQTAIPQVPVTPDGWISCSERMPEMGERQCYVLAADFKNNYPPNIPYTQVGVYGDWFNDGNPTWDDGDGEDLYLKEVTHWMPLPEPPRLKEL
ncbi:DUF551 domain-containing protein [Escherichia coli]|jgi:hypothetical protein|nr:DUF551 domain-containing protein [Escherichia coli]KDX90346.1 hypothetical protein AC46_0066 [Escherichia coli 2-222-05_S3_C3]KEN89337.1 hypothetical protein AB88_2877 [Escherichia coli 2-222-05_S3_C1]NNR90803.1 DUF551 domain-containing protein [Escherichia coli]NNR90858.1 DUF551 domain-containing protein [Escherichia coli]